jgi:hypothetical protein
MAIVKFHCNSGANIDSCRTATLDTVKDLGLEEGEFESMSENDQYEIVQEWANDRLEIYWEYA